MIQTLFEQQKTMLNNRVHNLEDRIVRIALPHVRPMVRGKKAQNVEFRAKINVSLVNGFAFIEKLSWNTYNEGTELIQCVKNYVRKFGYLPKKVLVDKIYCTRKNRRILKEYGIELAEKPLGRPKKQAANNRLRHGERNPIEG